MRVFYSWQSDIPEHRKVIEKAIKIARKSIPDFELVTATSNKTGAFRIDNNIIEKIKSSDLYIADLSIIGNLGIRKRRSPNPNVVYETGFAHGVLSEDNMFLLSQTENNGTEKFPFDLRNRRIAFYDFKSDNVRNELSNDFTNFFKKYNKKYEDKEIDMYVQAHTISSDGSMHLEFTNEEDSPYYIETASIDGHTVEINRFLKARDSATLSVKFTEYPFVNKPENFSLVFSRNKKRYQSHQLIESENRADGRYNLSRIIPKIENCMEI